MSDSSSIVQREAEAMSAKIFGQETGICVERNKWLKFGIQKVVVDIYSEEHQLIGEIYSHVGRLKSAQADKVKRDI